MRFRENVQPLGVGEKEIDDGHVGMSILQMELGLPQFVGAAQPELAGAGRVQHLRQATRVNGIAFDQKNLQGSLAIALLSRRGLDRVWMKNGAAKGP